MIFREEKMIDGIRHVLNRATGDWSPEVMYDKLSMTWILDERSENLRYLLLSERKLSPSEITIEMKKQLFSATDEAEKQTAERMKTMGLTEAEFDLIPMEEAHLYYKTAQGYWKEISDEQAQTENLHGKYITLRREYLMNHQPEEYMRMKEQGILNHHLAAINLRVHEMLDMLTDKMKADSEDYQTAKEMGEFMKTVRLSQIFSREAEEVVMRDIIYV